VVGLLFLCLSVGLADSINPTTLAPGVYLATLPRARAALVSYTLGVVAVYFLGGLLITLGPGELIKSIAPHPRHHVKHLIEVGVGVIAGAAALGVWLGRRHIQERVPEVRDPTPRSTFVLGASITAIELPTAFPYFAVIAAIIGTADDHLDQVIALVVFNVAFAAPLLGMLALREWGGARAERLLVRAGDWFQRNSAALLAVLLALVSLGFFVAGGIPLARGR
jgi:cytochrome c biogenesis protein CcdA